ncbi:vesicle-associated membrane 7 [Lecanosticta acicola]|uniref:Synaptobrevin homolog YKT6 n=1 Tax=Lecanosticta acicola TaxID=111012 RepID=A0AAI8Z0U6_9PEZI|nr:vesicle-associated membrane 7 [Lecanosticta acicola]
MASSSAPAAPLLYSCIAYRETILTEHTTTSATTQSSALASAILPKVDHDTPQKITFTHDESSNFIHYIADASTSSNPDNPSAAGLTYLVVAKRDVKQSRAFQYLLEIKRRFLSQYPPTNTQFSSLPPYGAGAFNATLRQLMQSSRQSTDAFSSVQNEIESVRGIMTENIERVLERGERIDLLVDKTDRLGGSASDFRVRSRGLRRQMWWKNVRLMVLLSVVVVFLLYLFVGFGCGLPAWGKCIG